MPRVHPMIRLVASRVIGTILVLATLQICDRYQRSRSRARAVAVAVARRPVRSVEVVVQPRAIAVMTAVSDHRSPGSPAAARGRHRDRDRRAHARRIRAARPHSRLVVDAGRSDGRGAGDVADRTRGRSSCIASTACAAAPRRELLAAAGVDNVLNLSGGLAGWPGPREFGPGVLRGPSPWLIDNADLLPRGGRVLDVACGRGRHALLLASAGFEVRAIDRRSRDDRPPARAGTAAGPQRRCGDRRSRNRTATRSRPQEYDAVLVFNYLHRPLMPALRDAVKPGGRIFYETFTTRQAERGHPRNPAFLLRTASWRTDGAADDRALPGRRVRRALHCVDRCRGTLN